MIRLLRIVGFMLMGAGAVALLTWVVRPLRLVWPWFRALPFAIQLGLGAAVAGLLLLMATLIWERLEDRERDRSLLDEL